METEARLTLDDEISRQTPVKMAGKISSVDITLESRGVMKVGNGVPCHELGELLTDIYGSYKWKEL